jgi:transposase
MPGAYSADLRERVLIACERDGASRAKIASLFRVGESTVYRWLQAWRTEGRREARPRAGGPAPRLDVAALDELKGVVAGSNDLTLAEYAARLEGRAGVRVSGSTVCRALKKLGLPRKKRRCGRASGIGPISSPPARLGAPSWPRSTRDGWSSSTRAASTPA